ncbi:AI-2E family transporter [Dysgonomonas sp. 511]|uniref:AI-2E family transporter n=1 Tax=Dysgonomonas sp. 511 TaxID=2302930 RepID=UPI0034CE684E|nr:AI-2E family transporter [Dysgonomonas sp. 511]
MTVKEQYWKYSLIVLILFMGIVMVREMAPFLGGILGASTIYVLLRRQMFCLVEKKKFRKSLAASLILIEAVMFFLIPISAAVWLLIEELHGINLNLAATVDTIQQFASRLHEKIGYNIFSTDNIVSAVGYLPKIGQMLVNSVASFVINALVMIFVLYFMLIGGRKMENYFYSLLPFSTKNKRNVMHEINMMVKSNAIGIPLLAIIQGGVALIGYLIFDVPNPILFAFFTCFATIIPLVGTGLVWLPLSVYLVISGDWFNGIALTVFGLIVISNSDNLIRFILQKKMADTHPLITVFGVVIGLTLFGFWGVIFGPLLMSMFVICLNIFKREYLDAE